MLIGAAIVALAAVAIFAWLAPPSASCRVWSNAPAAAEPAPARSRLMRAFHADLAVLVQYAEQRLGLRGTRLTSVEIKRVPP